MSIFVQFNPDETEALKKLARRNLRLPAEQIRSIVRFELLAQGILKPSVNEMPHASPDILHHAQMEHKSD